MARFSKAKLVFTLLSVFFMAVSFRATVGAVPPATQFMPGFPIVAGETIMAMWLPVPGAVKYVLYVNDKKVAEGVTPPIQFPTPAEGGEYRLQIAAVDAKGAEGPKSAPSVIKILKLSPPEELEGRSMAGNVALRWKGSPAAVIYNVFRSEQPGKNYELLTSTQMTQYSDSTVKKDKEYYYAVTAKDVTGKESSYSKEVAVSTKEATAGKDYPNNTLEFVATDHVTEYVYFGSQSLQSPVDVVSVGGRLFILNGATGTINIVDRESGDFIKKVGGRLPASQEAQVGIGYGLGADRKGRVFLCAGSKVVVFDSEGEVLKVLSPPPPADRKVVEAARAGSGGRPVSVAYYDMAEAADGSILIVDNGYARILVLDPVTLEVRKEFGRYGTKEGEFKHPGFIGVGKNGDIWINDSLNRRGQVFKSDYTFKYVAGEAKTFVGSFLGMGGVAVDGDGNFIVTDPPMATIQVFQAGDGKYLHHFAGPDKRVDPGNPQRPFWPITNPAGVYLDAGKGLLYICSTQTDELLVRKILK